MLLVRHLHPTARLRTISELGLDEIGRCLAGTLLRLDRIPTLVANEIRCRATRGDRAEEEPGHSFDSAVSAL